MTDMTSDQPCPEQPTSLPVESGLDVRSPITPLPERRGVKWGRIAVVIVLLFVGLAWGIGWLEPLIDMASPTLRPVTGTVRYNGQPLTKGFVRTIHERGGRMGGLGPINADGTFELTTNDDPGAFVGRHRVIVLCFDGGMPPKSILPERYSEPRLTPLVIQVSRTGPNQVQIELEDAKTP